MDLLPHRRLQNVQMVAKMTQQSLTVVSRHHHIPSYKKVSSHTCKGNMIRIVHCIEMYKFTVSMVYRNVQCKTFYSGDQVGVPSFLHMKIQKLLSTGSSLPHQDKKVSKLSQKTLSHHTTVFTGCVELLMINKFKFMCQQIFTILCN